MLFYTPASQIGFYSDCACSNTSAHISLLCMFLPAGLQAVVVPGQHLFLLRRANVVLAEMPPQAAWRD